MSEHGWDEPRDADHERRLGRREFIKGGVILGAATLLVPRVEKLLATQAAQRIFVPSGQPSLTRWLRRREDFVHLFFEFYNLRLDPTGTKLVRVAESQDAFIVVNFPPQYLVERAIPLEGEPGNETFARPDDPQDPPIPARIGGQSRLAFFVPAGVDEIDFTADGVLAWDPLRPNVVPAASLIQASATPGLRAPGPKETAIEAPWWLILSTSEAARWRHRTTPLTSPSGRTEVWRTELVTSKLLLPADLSGERRLRAVWARDPRFGEFVCELDASRSTAKDKYLHQQSFDDGSNANVALTSSERFDLVLNTSDRGQPGYTPTTFWANALALSALGTSLDAEGNWGDEERPAKHPKASLLAWLNRGALGRDNYVRTVNEGHLFPFGHLAVKVSITERTPHATKSHSGRPAAYLFKRTYYVVLERERRYPASNQPDGFPDPHKGRALPFNRILAATRVTPSLVPEPFNATDVVAEVPELHGKPFGFEFIGIDREGNEIRFTSPVVFVTTPAARDPDRIPALGDKYNALAAGSDVRPRVELDGQRVALGKPQVRGDTSLVAERIVFKAHHLGEPNGQNVGNPDAIEEQLNDRRLPAFWPAMDEVEAAIPAAAQAAGAPGAHKLVYDLEYLRKGFPEEHPGDAPTNPGELFVVLKTPAPLTFGTGARAGAVANPDFKIDGLSRSHGPVADALRIRAGDFQAKTFFAGIDARLLGGISLTDVIENGGLSRVPKLTQQEIGGTPGKPDKLITELHWVPQLKADGPLELGTNPALEIDARYVTDILSPEKSTASIVGDLRDVNLVFPKTEPILEVKFKRIRFSSVQGSKPDVRVDLDGIGFPDNSPLRLVDKLRSFLGPALAATAGQHGPAVDVTPNSIEATYTLPVPAVEVGIFLLQNVTVLAGLHIPFGAKPVRGTYAFSSRENPFLVTVSALGGGGHLLIRAGLDGIETVEGSLEFGGSTGINLGVAKGSVHILGGVYYKVPGGAGAGGKVVLEGYQRMGGRLRVLGLVTVSAEFYMGLKWVPADDKVVGKASLTIEIDMVAFSESVTMSVQRKFGGNGADPSFGQLQDEDEWTTYCRAFASEVTT